jgi:TRAP-type mannitol/chloroaromatic compound transport system substrate-binding protein
MNSRNATSPIITLTLVALVVLLIAMLALEKTRTFSGTGGFRQQAGDGEIFQWRLVTSWPKNLPGLGTGPENFAKLVEEMSDGRLRVQVFGAGELVPALGVFDAVSGGAAEMGHSGSYYYKGKISAAPFFTAVPFGMNTQEMNAWIHYGGGLELWRELYRPFNIIPFPGGNTGVQMAGWFNRELNQAEDLRGIKMRIPGIAGEVFQLAGGVAVNIPGGELYTAMQTGVIDAVEWVGPYNDRAFGLHQVGRYYYYPGWHEITAMLEFQINLDAWNRLPPDLQAIVAAATRVINQDMMDEYTAQNARALATMRENGLDIRPLPDEVLAALNQAAVRYYQEESARSPTFARVYRHYVDFMQMVREWHDISEYPIYQWRENSAAQNLR